MNNYIGENIRRLREAAGLTQEQLATRMKAQVGWVRRWESGWPLGDERSGSNAARLARALGVKVSTITDPPRPAPKMPHYDTLVARAAAQAALEQAGSANTAASFVVSRAAAAEYLRTARVEDMRKIVAADSPLVEVTRQIQREIQERETHLLATAMNTAVTRKNDATGPQPFPLIAPPPWWGALLTKLRAMPLERLPAVMAAIEGRV